VGFVPGGQVIEVASVDPNRGPIFYALEQTAGSSPRFTRGNDCMQCHLGPKTLNVPGLLVRSVHTAANGVPVSQVSEFVNGHNSPLQTRWGGWYVTGTHTGAPHLGNVFCENEYPSAENASTAAPSAPLSDLHDRFDTSKYLSPHSDIVALLVLEHQVRMQNLITRANDETRRALQQKAEQGASSAPDSAWPQQRFTLAGELLLEYLLFRNEAPLEGPVQGTSGFTTEFEKSGPRDSQGRSLRQFDLKSRLFRYPCSYLVYSTAFDALPAEMRSYLWKRLDQILTGRDQSPTYAGMGLQDRQNVLEILRDTKPEFAEWLLRHQQVGMARQGNEKILEQ
jgi:hypothetical protein